VRIAVIGVGLIGGSIALAARERLHASIAGFDARSEALRTALHRGALDDACQDVAEAVAGADAVFVAVPVGAVSQAVGVALAAAPGNCVISDVGSTKRAGVATHSDPRFVGGHPLAGAETPPFPIEDLLNERELRHVKRLYGIGGLSYGNLSARQDAKRFWMSASGVDKARLEEIGRDILLVSDFDEEAGKIVLSVPPEVERDARPSWLTAVQGEGRSSAGTTVMAAVESSEDLYAASLVVAGATVKACMAAHPDVLTLLASADHPEDHACARYMEGLIRGEQPDLERLLQPLRDSERYARALSGTWPGFPPSDIELSLAPDLFDFAMPATRRTDCLRLTAVSPLPLGGAFSKAHP